MSKTLSIDLNILKQYNPLPKQNNSTESDIELNILCVVLTDLGFNTEIQGHVWNSDDVLKIELLKDMIGERLKGIPPNAHVKMTCIKNTHYLLNFIY